jgi:hypothetical protein
MTPPPTPSDADIILANWRIIWWFIGGFLIAMSIALGFLVRIIKKKLQLVKEHIPLFQKVMRMVEQFNGSEEETVQGKDGKKHIVEPFRPGMMAMIIESKEVQALFAEKQLEQAESLKRLESVQEAQGAKLEIVRHEVEHNGGGSIKDAMKRTEDDVVAVKQDVKTVQGVVHDVSAKIENLTDLIGAKIKPMLSLEATINHNTTTTVPEHPVLDEA